MKLVAPFTRAFPCDIMDMVLSYLDVPNLRSFALASSLSNTLAERFLWRAYHIRKSESPEQEFISERFTALIRIPHRARYVRKLVIGPCDWAWDQDLLRQLALLWPVLPRLGTLLLEMRVEGEGRPTPLRGNEFAPVIRSLVTHGAHLQLSVFKFEGWLRPGSDLHRFLLGQPRLTELIGVDMFATRVLQLGPDFLPALQLLVCDEPTIARSLLPGRPIDVLQIRLPMTTEQLSSICAVVQHCSGSLTTIMLSLLAALPSEGDTALQLITEHMKSVQRLVLQGVYVTEEGSFPLRLLSNLECLECDFPWLHDGPPDENRILHWTSQFSTSLRRIVVAPDSWDRNTKSVGRTTATYTTQLTRHRSETEEWHHKARYASDVRADWGTHNDSTVVYDN